MLVVALFGALLMFIFSLLDMLQGAGPSETFLDSLFRAFRAMPRKIEELAPFAVFLGALIGLGNLAANSELTVLRGAGVSVVRLFLSVCIPSLCMIALAQLLIPVVFAADERNVLEREQGFANTWLSEADSYTRIGWMDADQRLRDIRQYFLDSDGNLERIRTAESGRFQPDQGGWHLMDVTNQRYQPARIATEVADSGFWLTTRTPESLKVLFTVEPRKMSLLQLSKQIVDLKAVGQDPSDFQIVFWSKLTKPLSVLGLVLVALAFVVGSAREIGMGTRLTVGIIVGFVFHYVQTLIAPVSVVFNVPAVVAIIAPVLLVWLIGYALLRRTA